MPAPARSRLIVPPVRDAAVQRFAIKVQTPEGQWVWMRENPGPWRGTVALFTSAAGAQARVDRLKGLEDEWLVWTVVPAGGLA